MMLVELRSLSLVNFRNFAALDLKVPSGLVLFVGENAQGKSNLLEAVYMLSLSKSYRSLADRELVSWQAVREGMVTIVSGTVHGQGGQLDITIGLEYSPLTPPDGTVRKQIRVNGISRRAAELVGMLNTVLFSAGDLELVYGPPSARRRYLDVMLCQASSSYLRALQRYHRVIAQRNSLLRSIREGRASERELEFWDQSLCAEGSYILSARHEALASLGGHVSELYRRLMGVEQVLTVDYLDTAASSGLQAQRSCFEELAQALASSRLQERALAQTVVGPHRDDLRLAIAGVEMARSASRGQARLAALAMRLAEGAFLDRQRGEPPVLLLDDVFSELDERRRTLVMEEAQSYPQVLATTVSAELVAAQSGRPSHQFRVVDGSVREAGPSPVVLG